VALAVILLVGAGLLIRSLIALNAIDTGFRAERLLTMRVSLPALPESAGLAAAGPQTALAIAERMSGVPGVERVGVGSTIPLTGGSATSYVAEGQPPTTAEDRPRTYRHTVMPGYFDSLGVALAAGRDFTAAEVQQETPATVIVSESLARRFWPDQGAIGRRIKVGGSDSTDPWLTIVGVVGDVKWRGLPRNPTADPDIFQPFRPQSREFALLVRMGVPTETAIDAVRSAIRSVEPQATLFSVEAMEDRVAERMARPRFVSWLMGVFAGLALLLSAIGIYGVLSQNVARRTQEIGVRMALGASAGEILRLMLRRGLALVAVGLAIGAAAALTMTRLLQTLLFGVSRTDPATFAGVAVMLGVVALVATWIPARRAMRVDPLVALRRD